MWKKKYSDLINRKTGYRKKSESIRKSKKKNIDTEKKRKEYSKLINSKIGYRKRIIKKSESIRKSKKKNLDTEVLQASDNINN